MNYLKLIFIKLVFFNCIYANCNFIESNQKLSRLITEVEENKKSSAEALLEINEIDLEILLKPSVNLKTPDIEIFKGTSVSTGATVGAICFNGEKLAEYQKKFGSVIWITQSIKSDDLCYLKYANGICAFKEDPSSHAIIVVRVHNIPAVTLLQDAVLTPLGIETKTGVLREGDLITLDAFNGLVYSGEKPIIHPSYPKVLDRVMEWADIHAHLSVHANADTANEAQEGLIYGSKGVDPRSEHMFFHPDSLKIFRTVILQKSEEALRQLKEIQKNDILRLFQTMGPLPVKLRLFDPPLHEFLPCDQKTCRELANSIEIEYDDLQAKIDALAEVNPMMGHRGVRLLLTFPEILKMQAEAIFEAAADPSLDGVHIEPVIILPMIVSETEVVQIKEILEQVRNQVSIRVGKPVYYKIGVMIETPRACLLADKIAEHVDYFSFGTNDLTGLTFGFSRGDVFEKFLLHYLKYELLPYDPFSQLDPAVVMLMEMTVTKARKASHYISIGICGEQASEKSGVFMCHILGLDSVSCAPQRIPTVRLFAAQAAILHPKS